MGDRWSLANCEDKKPYICEYRSDGDNKISIPCPRGWKPFEDNCYYAVPRKVLGWNDARTLCKNSGADLTSVTSMEEQTFVNNLMSVNLVKFL